MPPIDRHCLTGLRGRELSPDWSNGPFENLPNKRQEVAWSEEPESDEDGSLWKPDPIQVVKRPLPQLQLRFKSIVNGISTQKSLSWYCSSLGLNNPVDREKLLAAAREYKHVPKYREMPLTGRDDEFQDCIDGFLRRHGNSFWGSGKSTKFVLPQDHAAIRAVIEAMFWRKAVITYRSDRQRDKTKKKKLDVEKRPVPAPLPKETPYFRSATVPDRLGSSNRAVHSMSTRSSHRKGDEDFIESHSNHLRDRRQNRYEHSSEPDFSPEGGQGEHGRSPTESQNPPQKKRLLAILKIGNIDLHPEQVGRDKPIEEFFETHDSEVAQELVEGPRNSRRDTKLHDGGFPETPGDEHDGHHKKPSKRSRIAEGKETDIRMYDSEASDDQEGAGPLEDQAYEAADTTTPCRPSQRWYDAQLTNARASGGYFLDHTICKGLRIDVSTLVQIKASLNESLQREHLLQLDFRESEARVKKDRIIHNFMTSHQNAFESIDLEWAKKAIDSLSYRLLCTKKHRAKDSGNKHGQAPKISFLNTSTTSTSSADKTPTIPSQAVGTERHIEQIDLTVEDDVATVKKEYSIPRTQVLAPRIIRGTMLYLTVNTLPHRARWPVPFAQCSSFETFFNSIMDQSGIPAHRTETITFVNVKFNWKKDSNQICVQRDNLTHWTEFCNELEFAWESPEQFERGVCKVDVGIFMKDKDWE